MALSIVEVLSCATSDRKGRGNPLKHYEDHEPPSVLLDIGSDGLSLYCSWMAVAPSRGLVAVGFTRLVRSSMKRMTVGVWRICGSEFVLVFRRDGISGAHEVWGMDDAFQEFMAGCVSSRAAPAFLGPDSAILVFPSSSVLKLVDVLGETVVGTVDRLFSLPGDHVRNIVASDTEVITLESPRLKMSNLYNCHSAQESTSYGEKVARTKIPTTPQKSGNE